MARQTHLRALLDEELRRPQVAPLVVARGAARGEIRVRRRVRCGLCKGARCRACEFVGWHCHDEPISVAIAEGSPIGGVVDVPLPPDAMGDAEIVRVELVEEGPRADALRASLREHGDWLDRIWTSERDEAAEKKRLGVFGVAILCVVVIVAGGGGIWLAIVQAARKPIAAACARSSECRSDDCRMFGPGVGSVCTSDCTVDADCPAGIRCVGVQMMPDGLPYDVAMTIGPWGGTVHYACVADRAASAPRP